MFLTFYTVSTGKGWKINYDSSVVTGNELIQINAGIFTEAYKIRRQHIGYPSYELFADTWFVQNVGLVKMDLIESDTWRLRFRNERWELIWYHLTE